MHQFPSDADAVSASFGSGKVIISRNGGQLISWQINGKEQLYLSPLAKLGPGQSIRGGVPVIFPQFAAEGSGPRHGFARTAIWQLESITSTDLRADIELLLSESTATMTVWPHRFKLHQRICAFENTLEIMLTIQNIDNHAWSFSAALHSYWPVADLASATISGLDSQRFSDRADQPMADPCGSPPFIGEIERLYRHAPATIVLHSDRQISLTNTGFSNWMIWNPGPEKAVLLNDLPHGDNNQFICIEPLALSPITLAPGEKWHGSHKISIHQDS